VGDVMIVTPSQHLTLVFGVPDQSAREARRGPAVEPTEWAAINGGRPEPMVSLTPPPTTATVREGQL
jgi:hypothetical protein